MPGRRVGRATSGKAPPPRLLRRGKRTADSREGGGGEGRSIAATDYLTLRDKLFDAYYAKHSYLVTTCDNHMLTGATASFFYFFFSFSFTYFYSYYKFFSGFGDFDVPVATQQTLLFFEYLLSWCALSRNKKMFRKPFSV